jgi:gliding motility-associated-like protein
MKQLITFLTILIHFFSFAQNTELSVTGNSFITIPAGANLTTAALGIYPSATQTIQNTILTIGTVVAPTLDKSASKMYNWSNPILNFSGDLKVSYLDAEVSGLLESKLEIYAYNGTQWQKGTGLVLNTAQNIITNTFNSQGIQAISFAAITDIDADGIDDAIDNCPSTPNADQADTDGDGVGDVCDNCINTSNATQLDTDGDGIGNDCDTDDDGDGVPDTSDVFPLDSTESTDTDGDGTGDNADTDNDNDGVLDTLDNCLYMPNADQLDTDADGIGNVCDSDDDNDGFSDADEITCGTDPLLASSLPADTDSDGIANCIDTDDDNDGYLDTDETTCGSDPLDATSKPLDTDSDGTPNCIDTDDDNDSYLDENDAFPLDETEWTDTDSDGIGNNADTDDDGDGQLDTDETACGSDPLLASSLSLDTDSDSVPDCVDTDDDGDGVLDTSDAYPLDPAEWADTDADGIGNNADTDDDGDGQSDYNELVCGSDPLDQYSKSSDIDSDNIPDCVDEDKDGDGYLNDNDAFPEDGSEWIDTDGDGLGDNFEVDKDNDGILDIDDAFPLDPNESKDSDGDGIGDNADLDDNNDGFTDEEIFTSGVLTPASGGLESTWKIINLEKYPNARVSVYNKSGQEVFNKLGYKNDWRGTFNNGGEPLPAGSYYYMIDLNNGSKALTGWLYITY